MDWRLLIVLLPLIVAGAWAVSKIGPIALQQVQQFLAKES